MKNKLLIIVLLLSTSLMLGQTDKISVKSDASGMRLQVNGKDFMINGMNWDYVPIGTNVVDANFYKKSDEVIRAGLDAEMALLQNMKDRKSVV